MSDLSINDQTFRIEIEGDTSRPALILSNALGVDLDMWAPQMTELAKHFRVIRYDPRGHGGTPAAPGPVSIATLGGDVVAILDALGIEKAHFLGLSMGGAVGLWLLANAPERIERAILANTAPVFGDPDPWNARIASVLGNGMGATAQATMERWFSTDFATREPARVEAIHDVMIKTSPQGYAACCAALRDLDLRETLPAIGHEVLIVSGTDDPVVPTPTLDAFVGGLPGAKHVALECRHLSNVEAAAGFNAAVIDFLTAKPARLRPASRRAAPAPTAPIKTVKRGGATRRSNAARSPLSKPDAKKTPARKPRSKTSAATRPAPKAARTAAPAAKSTGGKRPPAKRAASTSRTRLKAAARKTKAATKTRGATKTRNATKTRSATKSAAKKTTTKARKAAAAKPVTTRRKTKTTAARAPIKKSKPRKAAAPTKATAKKAVRKTTAKKAPAPRRSPAKKPRRPTGRRT